MTDKYQGCMPDSLFKTLTPAKEVEFRQWARDNWAPVTPPKFGLYHPSIRDEWRRIDESMILDQPIAAPETVAAIEPNTVVGVECEPCRRFFALYRCAAETHGECDCPKCQGYCKCEEVE